MDIAVDTRTADAKTLTESLTLITPVADRLMTEFYGNLFTQYPKIRDLFQGRVAMGAQRDKLLAALVSLATYYDQPDFLIPVLEDMGRRHTRYGATLDGYTAVGLTLQATLRHVIGEAWTPTYAAAWERAFLFAAGTMLAAGAVAHGLAGVSR